MIQRERQGWKIVASLFLTLFVVWGGGINTGAVFFPALLKHFSWSRAHLSTLGSAGAIAAGLVGPLIGSLLDRFEARRVMVAGTLATAIAFLAASRVNSYIALLLANLVIAIGVTAATVIPCSLIVSNWFGARRGLALGVTFAGTSMGGMFMTMVSNYAIASGGWRAGYVTLAIPMIVVVIPVLLLAVRSRPPEASPAAHLSAAPDSDDAARVGASRSDADAIVLVDIGSSISVRMLDRRGGPSSNRLFDRGRLRGESCRRGAERDLLSDLDR